jgi:YfiH family protein
VFAWEDRLGGARLAFTDRRGGVSDPPYDSLNLGGHVGDDPEHVEENRRRVAAAFGVPRSHLVFMHQVHGRGVAVIDAPPADDAPLPAVDALVTANPDVALVALVADCAPVLLADPVAGVVAAAHAGRAGMAAGVIDATLEAMTALGAEPARSVARVGPTVCGRCYEVPAQLRDEVGAVVPAGQRAGPAKAHRRSTCRPVSSRSWPCACTTSPRSARARSSRRSSSPTDASGVTGRSAGVVRALPR